MSSVSLAMYAEPLSDNHSKAPTEEASRSRLSRFPGNGGLHPPSVPNVPSVTVMCPTCTPTSFLTFAWVRSRAFGAGRRNCSIYSGSGLPRVPGSRQAPVKLS